MTKPIVAIVGRPNVGKSTLFNRLIDERLAIVSETAGTTRDRLYGEAEFAGREFIVVDTGGLALDDRADLPGTPAAMLAGVRAQAQIAIDEADAIVFMVDVEQGITPSDSEIANILRRADKPVYLVVNKADNDTRVQNAVEFFQLGLGDPLPISALHGVGTGDLLDKIIAKLPPETTEPPSNIPHLAIVGRPNVGKSSLLNAILGEERVIVSEVPGTTRDVIDTPFVFEGQQLVLIDTAGLRRRGSIEPGVEKHSTLRARRALERAQVALCVFDISEGLTAQDTHVIGYAIDAARGIVVVANKWDLVRDGERTQEEWERRLRWQLKFASWLSIRFISARDGEGIRELLAEAARIGAERQRRVDTGALNQALRRAVAEKPPPTPSKGKRIKLLYVTQAEVEPPTFVFFLNDASAVHFSYRRYMENVIRRNFGFAGTAVKLVFRSRNEDARA